MSDREVFSVRTGAKLTPEMRVAAALAADRKRIAESIAVALERARVLANAHSATYAAYMGLHEELRAMCDALARGELPE